MITQSPKGSYIGGIRNAYPGTLLQSTCMGLGSLECSFAPGYERVRSSRKAVHSNAVVGIPWLADQVRKIISPPNSPGQTHGSNGGNAGQNVGTRQGSVFGQCASEPKVQGTQGTLPTARPENVAPGNQPASKPTMGRGCKQGLARAFSPVNREPDLPIRIARPRSRLRLRPFAPSPWKQRVTTARPLRPFLYLLSFSIP